MKTCRMIFLGLVVGCFLLSGPSGWAMGKKPAGEETAGENQPGLREHLAERPLEPRAIQIESGLIETDEAGGKA